MDLSATKVMEKGLFGGHFKQSESAHPTAHRLLVVDDDAAVLEIIQDMLHFKGYRVVAVADGKKALEAIETEEFDLVLTDLGMPGISGWEIAKKVKDKDPSLPVVVLTGWGAEFEKEDLLSEGIDLLLRKPLSWAELTESIRKLL